MFGRLSLRARLLLGVVALTAVGLVAADLATYTALRSFLFDRVDSTLNSVHVGVESALFAPHGPGPGPTPAPGGNQSLQELFTSVPGDCIEVRTLAGAVGAQG